MVHFYHLDTGHKVTYIRRSEDAQDVLSTSYIRSDYFMRPWSS